MYLPVREKTMIARRKLLTTGLTLLFGLCLAFAVAQANVTINSDVDGTLTLNDVEYIVAGSSVEVGAGLFGPSSLEATLSLNGQSVDPLMWVPIELLCHLTGYVADPIILADAGATLTATITISGTGFSGTMTDVCSGSIALSKAELESGNFDALYNHSVSGNLTIDDETQVGLPYEKKEMRFHFEDDGTGSGSATFAAAYNEATVEVTITYSFTYSGSVDWNLPADFGGYAIEARDRRARSRH